MAERLGREIAILLGLRDRNQIEEGIIAIDELLVRSTGLTSRFINSLPEDTLIKALSPLGALNTEALIWVAALLKTEGILYERLVQQDRSTSTSTPESSNGSTQGKEAAYYYRYVKSLYLFLEALQHEPALMETQYMEDIKELLLRLETYELPANLTPKIMRYYEHIGSYAKVEDILTEHLETYPNDTQILGASYEFYERLQRKNTGDLETGNFSRAEIQEGIDHLEAVKHTYSSGNTKKVDNQISNH
jgi:hypothetical protein